MRWRMLFRLGLSLIILVAIFLFYLNNSLFEQGSFQLDKEQLLKQAVGSIDLKIDKHDSHSHSPISGVQIDKGDEMHHSHSPISGVKIDKDDRMRHSHSPIAGEKKPSPNVQTGLQVLHRRVGKRMGVGERMHLAVVACGDRGEEALVLLKSALIMSPTTPLVFHIFAEQGLHQSLVNQLAVWGQDALERIDYRVYNITYPVINARKDAWKKLFKPCASQRLFLPYLLTDVDSLMYLDIDTLFVSPVHQLWDHFHRFNQKQLVALAPEHEDPNVGWYNRFARHPYVSPLGVNSGVMLMNLTRLRRSAWFDSMISYHNTWRFQLTWGDQDLINIYFYYFPDELYIYNCAWNFRPDHCMYMSVCKPAEESGAFVLHGCRQVMKNDKQPAFKAVYNAFQNFSLGDSVEHVLLRDVKWNLDKVRSTSCGSVPHIFLKQLSQFVARSSQHKTHNPKVTETPHS